MPLAIHETLRNFLSLAKGERVPPHFIGSLAACLFPNTSVVETPVFYVIREDSIDVFNRETSLKVDNVLGLVYGLVAQNRLEELRFWFPPSLSGDQVRQVLLRLLPHTTKGLEPDSVLFSALDSAYYMMVQELARKVEWKNDEGYRLYVLDAAVTITDVGIGSTWEIDGETFEMDAVHIADAPILLSQTEIPYDQDYMVTLINHPVVSKLIRVVRLVSTKQPVAWSLVHCDFSIGLLSTLPEYRRKGLVQRALSSTIVAYRDVAASHDGLLGIEPHCFVSVENVPSQKLMASVGFEYIPDKTFHWLAAVV
ncbi:hypothetical protein LEN26_014983 [Aphanomyces euteiches]|nr:hypothetical protein LEN26_014983 [Aphanomyces euteiches]KAH9108438.1 hypothetical protein AeMF1_016385 [Aphanomyces euteiches]